jgi:hypothetical protein
MWKRSHCGSALVRLTRRRRDGRLFVLSDRLVIGGILKGAVDA